MTEMFSLEPEYAKRLHPEALKWFNARRAEIRFKVPLEELSYDDLNTFLSDDEKREFIRYKDEINRGLATCINMDEASPDPMTKAIIGLSLVTFQAQSLLPMRRIGLLLKNVHLRKVAKAKQEQRERDEEDKRSREQAEAERRRKEEEERWHIARNAVSPPLSDAKRYLNDKDYHKFTQAALEATEAYLEKGEKYLDSVRTFDYRWYLKKIKDRKEEEQIRNDAQAQAQAFHARLNQGLEKIERGLSPKKEDPAVFFKKWCSNNGESRYLGESFTDILASNNDENGEWTQGYISAAKAKLQQSIPEEIRDFILTQPTVSYFLLPTAHYAFYGLPCMNFGFDVFAVVTIAVLAQPREKMFNGYIFDFLSNLREPKQLGIYQITVSPNQPHLWQSVPLTLLFALIDGNLQPQGTTILEQTDHLTVYEVNKFEENICEIPISFERYCRSLGSLERMREVHIINERTAEILETLRLQSTNQQESKGKKAKAFLLFNQGKRPSDPEVKTLGIKPNTAYRYYQAWKEARNSSNLTSIYVDKS